MTREKQERQKIAELSKLVSRHPDSIKFVDLAKLLVEYDEHQRATEICEVGLKHHPQDADGHLVYGKALLSLKRFEEGIRILEKASALRVKSVDIALEAAKALVSQGHIEAGLHFVKKALEIDPSDPRAKALEEYIREENLDSDPANQTRAVSVDELQEFVEEYPGLGRSIAKSSNRVDPMTVSARSIGHDDGEEEEVIFDHESIIEDDEDQSTVLVDLNGAGSYDQSSPDFEVPFEDPSDYRVAVYERPVASEPRRYGVSRSREARLYDYAPRIDSGRTQQVRHYPTKRRKLSVKRVLLWMMPLFVAGLGLGAYLAYEKILANRIDVMLEQITTAVAEDTAEGVAEAESILHEIEKLDETNQRAATLSTFLSARKSDEHESDLDQKRDVQRRLDDLSVLNDTLSLSSRVDLLWARYHISINPVLQQEVNDLVRRHADNIRLLSLAGELAMHAGQLDQAEGFFIKSLKLQPGQVRTLNRLARLERQRDRLQPAMEYLEKALAIHAFHTNSLLDRCEIKIQNGDALDQVKSDLEKVLALPKAAALHRAHAYVLLATIEFLGSNRTSAVQAVEEAARITSENISFVENLALLCRKYYELDQAELLAEKVLKATSDNVKTRLFLIEIDFLKGKISQSLKALDDLAGIKVPRGLYFTLRGEILSALGRYAASIDELSKVPDDAQEAPRARAAMTLALIGAEKVEDAFRVADSFVRDHPTSPLAHFAMGKYRLAKKSYGSAADSFHKAISLDPRHYPSLAELGWMAYRQNELDTALRYANQSIGANPYDESTLVLMGQLKLEAGDSESALAYFTKVVQENDVSKSGLLGMVKALLQLNKLDEAEQTAKRAKEVAGQEAVTYHLVGKVYLAQKRYLNAKRALVIASRMEEHDAEVLADLGLAQLETRAYAEAQRSFEESLKVKRLLQARAGLAGARMAQGRHKEAAEEYSNAAEQAMSEKRPSTEIAGLFMQAGRAWLKDTTTAGRFKPARKAFEKAAQLVPNDPEPLYMSALAWDQGADLNQARKVYLSVLQLDTYHAKTLFRLGQLEYDEENDQEAKKYLERFLATQPKGVNAKQAIQYLKEIEANLARYHR